MPKQTKPYNPLEMYLQAAKNEASGCWELHKVKNSSGYARVRKNGSYVYAHRESWEIANGRDAGNLCVCHKCDNPLCINPDHLFLGTLRENFEDMRKKGRNRCGDVKGIDHPLAKLDETKVMEILSKWKPGLPRKKSPNSAKSLAKEYGVAHSLVHRIVTGQSWPHIFAKFHGTN
jgi:hypothetical protein